MTDTEIVPYAVKVAAKRGFIRTTSQAYAATLTTGISATIILGVVTGSVDVVATGITLGVAAVSPLLAGAASYLSILSRGIPEDYAAAV